MDKSIIKYINKQADIAHDLYKERGGSFYREWQGASKGFSLKIGNDTLWSEVMKDAEIICKYITTHNHTHKNNERK